MQHDHHNHSEEECQWEILRLANAKQKFGLEIGLPMCEHLVKAFERGIDMDWFTLVDINWIAAAPKSSPCRIFKLTQAGIIRKAELEKKFSGQATN